MDESSAASANLDQDDQDFLAHYVSDEIVEAAGAAKWETLNICCMTFGGWPSTPAACCGPV